MALLQQPKYFFQHKSQEIVIEERKHGIRLKPRQVMMMFQLHKRSFWLERLRIALRKKIHVIKTDNYLTPFLLNPIRCPYACVDLLNVPVFIRDHNPTEYIEISNEEDLNMFDQIYYKAFSNKNFKKIFESTRAINFTSCKNITVLNPVHKKLPTTALPLRQIEDSDGDDDDDDDAFPYKEMDTTNEVDDYDDDDDDDDADEQGGGDRSGGGGGGDGGSGGGARKRKRRDGDGDGGTGGSGGGSKSTFKPKKRFYTPSKKQSLVLKNLLANFSGITLLSPKSAEELEKLLEEDIPIKKLDDVSLPSIPDMDLTTDTKLYTGKEFLDEFAFWLFRNGFISGKMKDMLYEMREKEPLASDEDPKYSYPVFAYAFLLTYLTKKNLLKKHIDTNILMDSVASKIKPTSG